jgi:ATP-dependent helicase HepA
MARFNSYSCPFCRRTFQRLENNDGTGFRFHLSPGGPCTHLPAGYSDIDFQEIISVYERESDIRSEERRATPIVAPIFPDLSLIQVGNFVKTGDDHQVGRVLEITDGISTVRAFLGPGKFLEIDYPTSSLKRHDVPVKSRVYLQEDESEPWQIGRVASGMPDNPHTSYRIGRSGRPPLDLLETEIEILSGLAQLNPAELLASGAIEPQRLHENRQAAVQAIFGYRAQGRGLTGPLSASIELLPHQIAVVQRIMSDPIQRYLLADEVGLGKTVEAGSVIRQILLDAPDDEVVIVVPNQLVHQWTKELEEKFHLREYDGQIRIFSFDQFGELDRLNFTTLVIDEIHNLITTVGGDGLDSDTGLVDQLIAFCRQAERLLLMSATPVVANDPATQTMLHLLDPLNYPLGDSDQFAKRMNQRQQIGRLLLRIKTAPNQQLLLRAVVQLSDLIPDDAIVRESLKIISDSVGDDETALIVDVEARKLRRYISDIYRTHQRLIRTRRKDLPDWVLLPQSSTVKCVEVGDEVTNRIINHASNWNERLLTAESLGDIDINSDQIDLFTKLFDSISMGTEAIGEALDGRIYDDVEIESIKSEILRESNEESRAILSASLASSYLNSLRSRDNAIPKLVAFTSSAEDAVRFGNELKPKIGTEAVMTIVDGMTASEIDQQSRMFERHVEPSILVTDATGEEGLNLHFADGIVHLDLPFSAARLQQRIGRLDRFGRQLQSIHHLVMLPAIYESSPWVAWYELLRDGFNLFEQPISDIQFMLHELQNELDRVLFWEGAAGLEQMASQVSARIESERETLEDQYELDSDIMAGDADGEGFAFTERDIDEFDDESRAASIVNWATGEIGLTRRPVDGHDPSKVFKLSLGGRAKIPTDLAFSYLSEGLDKAVTRNRQTAINNPGVQLLRPGAEVIDNIADLLRVDAKGSTFATWRAYPAMNIDSIADTPVLRINYFVECNSDVIEESLLSEVDMSIIKAIRRRADAIFPPFTGTIHVGMDLDPDSIPSSLSEIARGEFDGEGKNELWRDSNLIDKDELLNATVDSEALAKACDRISTDLSSILRQITDFATRVKTAEHNADQLLQVENENINRRKIRLQKNQDAEYSQLDLEILINKAIAASISSPLIGLDSIGLIIISGRPPMLLPSAVV